MKTLERQLQEYGEYQIELRDPITSEAVTSVAVTPVVRSWWHGRPLLALLAGAIALLLLGTLSVLLAPDTGSVAGQAPIGPAVANKPGESVTFNGRTFRIRDGGPPYRIEELSEKGYWFLRDEYRYDYPPTITATEDRIILVSPSPGEGHRVCREYVLQVAVSSTGEDFHHAAINDLGDDIRHQETRSDRRDLPCMNLDGGGDAVGPVGILIVRVITRCCVDPYAYPHFWFSPDGREWQRVALPDEMARIDALEWGAPRATPRGFAIDVAYSEGDPDVDPPIVETWVSTDGFTWERAN